MRPLSLIAKRQNGLVSVPGFPSSARWGKRPWSISKGDTRIMFALTTSRITWTSIVGLLVGLLAASTGPVAATQPEDVSIDAHTERDCPGPTACVFTATGAITDYGTVTTDFIRATALQSPTVGTAQYVKTFH